MTGGPAVEVRLIGELDRDAAPAIADATDLLVKIHPRSVVIDLRELTFAGAELPNLLALLLDRLPGGATLEVRHPSPGSRSVLSMCDMAHLVHSRR